MEGKGQILAAVKPFGLGSAAVAIAGNTFQWVLTGKPALHASYWSHLLAATARKPRERETWQVVPHLPQTHRPATLHLVREEAQVPALTVDSTAVYPQQSAAGLPGWESTFWPRHEGWHTALTTTGEPFTWYAYGPGDWQDLQIRETYEATLAFTGNGPTLAAKTALTPVTRQEPIREVWFYLLFLLGAGYLWLERKL
jgi:hypothetical protein